MAPDLGVDLLTQPGTAPVQDWSDPGQMGTPTTRGGATAGYTLWMFDGSKWTMTKDRSAAGYVPSSPPSAAGRFKGQVRAILSVPAE